MLWKNGRRSDNIEDQRASGPQPSGRGGLVGGGIGTIVLALVALYFGVDPSVVLNQVAQQQMQQTAQHSTQQAPAALTAKDRQDKEFLSVVLADTEDTWGALFQQAGRQYVDPKLVLFSGAVL